MKITKCCFWLSFMTVWTYGCGEGNSGNGDDTDTSTEDGTAVDSETSSDSASEAPALNPVCEEMDGTWTADWSAFEEEFLSLINAERTAGADCGAEGTFEAMSPLTMDEALRCAARVLPVERRRQRRAVASPGQYRGALGRDAAAANGVPLSSLELLQGSAQRLFNRVDNLFRILFRSPGLWPRQIDAAHLSGRYLSACVEYHRAAGVRTLVNGEDVVHQRKDSR